MEIPTGYALVTLGLTSTGDSDQMVNTLGVSITDDSDLFTDLTDLGDAYAEAWGDNVSQVISRTVDHLYQSPADGGDVVEVTPASGVFGLSAGNVYANNTSYIMKKVAGIGGRKHRGRCFVPGVLVGNITDAGEVSPTQQGEINTALDTFLAAFPFGGIGGLYILHTDALVPPDAVLQLRVSPRLATTRHRYQN